MTSSAEKQPPSQAVQTRTAPLLCLVCADKRLILCIVRRSDCRRTNHHYSYLSEQAWTELDKSTWVICTQKQPNWKWSYIHEVSIVWCSFNCLKQFLGLVCSNDIPFTKALVWWMFQGIQLACQWSLTNRTLATCDDRYFTCSMEILFHMQYGNTVSEIHKLVWI